MSENKNNLLVQVSQVLIITVVGLLIAIGLMNEKMNRYSEIALKAEARAMDAGTATREAKIAHNKSMREYRNALSSISNQYVTIDDRYIVKCSIFEINKLRGPVWAFDMVLKEHLLTHIPYRADFRQCSVDELKLKFRHIE